MDTDICVDLTTCADVIRTQKYVNLFWSGTPRLVGTQKNVFNSFCTSKANGLLKYICYVYIYV